MAIQCLVCKSARDLPEDFNEWPEVVQSSLDIYEKTIGGKPIRIPYGFVRARWFPAPNEMRSFMQAFMQHASVSQRAVNSLLEPQKGKHMKEEKARNAILKL